MSHFHLPAVSQSSAISQITQQGPGRISDLPAVNQPSAISQITQQGPGRISDLPAPGDLKTPGDFTQTSPPPDKQQGPGRISDLPAPGDLKTPGYFTQTSPPSDKQVPKMGLFAGIPIKTMSARSISKEPASPFNQSLNSRGAYNVDDTRTTQGGQSMHMSKSFSCSPSLIDQPIIEKYSHDPLRPTDYPLLSYEERSQSSPSFSSETSSGGHQAAGFNLDSRKDLRRKNG